MYYTLGQAAKATGKGKTTIANAIEKGRLSAQKDDIGQYQIDAAELNRVYPVQVTSVPKPNAVRLGMDSDLLIKIAALEGELKARAEAYNDMKAELSRMHTLVTALLPKPETVAPAAIQVQAAKQAEDALAEVQKAAAHTQESEPPRKGFWGRLVG